MVDSLTKDQRHRVMANIHGKDTKPELAVRRLLFAAGYRYRLHAPDLPGRPDIVFAARHKVIFVNGCFWHSHSCPNGSHQPTTNADFWAAKRRRTVERDAQDLVRLAGAGWAAFTVWECELRRIDDVAAVLVNFLGPPRLHAAQAASHATPHRPRKAPAP